MSTTKTKNRFIILTILFINELFVGGIYAWSVFSGPLAKHNDWDYGQVTFAYSLMLLFMAMVGIPGGTLLDRFGPKKLMIASGALWGLGWLLTGYATSLPMLYVSFGLVCGSASGLLYTPGLTTAVRWFPDKKGLASGIIVGGVGLSPLLLAPLANTLLTQYDVMTSFKILGISFLVVSLATTWYIDSPPTDWQMKARTDQISITPVAAKQEHTWREMLKDRRFYAMWLVFLGASVAGLMMISHTSAIGQEVAGITAAQAALMVGIMAVANFGGRMIMGALSDRFGRYVVLAVALALSAVDMVLLSRSKGFFSFTVCLILLGLCFGGVLAVFPTIVSDAFGLKNMGLNYGIMFTAYGMAAIIGPMSGTYLHAVSGGYGLPFLAAGLFSLFSLFTLMLLIRSTAKVRISAKQSA